MADATTEAAETTAAADAAAEDTAPEVTDWGAHLTSMLSFSMGSSEATVPPGAPDGEGEAAATAALESDAATTAEAVSAEAVSAETVSAVETEALGDGEDGAWGTSLTSMLPTFTIGDESAAETPAGDFNQAEHEAMDEALAKTEVYPTPSCTRCTALDTPHAIRPSHKPRP